MKFGAPAWRVSAAGELRRGTVRQFGLVKDQYRPFPIRRPARRRLGVRLPGQQLQQASSPAEKLGNYNVITLNDEEFLPGQTVIVVDGRIAVGLAADLVLLADNPLEEVGAASRPLGVMVRGEWLDRARIDAGLAAIAARRR